MCCFLRKSIFLIMILALGGCGGGSGGSSGGGTSGSSVSLGGSAVKGPLANAIAEVYAIDPAADNLLGELIDSGTTNAQAAFSGINLDPASAPFILVVTADDDTIDITTGEAPIITSLRTIVTQTALTNNTPIYATPLTSMTVEVVSAQDDTSNENIQTKLTNAQNQVKTTLGFGMDETLDIFTTPPLLKDDTDTQEKQQAVAEYRLAIEALSAVVASIAESTTDDSDTAADVLAALAKDLADGELDGIAGETPVAELDGYDVSTLDDTDLSSLKVPGTEISINDIELVLGNDTETTGTSQTLNASIDVNAEAPILVADTDLDGFADNVDNCPVVENSNQSDTNTNGVGDVCDAAPSIAADLSVTVNEDGSVSIDLSEGVTDAEGDELSYSVGEEVLGGSSYLFAPEANVNGELSFDYSVSDGTSTTNGTVNVTVTPQNDPGSVSISGTAEQGQTLTATVSDAIDGLANAVILYAWSDNSGVIVGETGSTLTLTQDQVGESITVSASYTDDEGFSETVVSDATDAVVDINDAPGGQLSLTGVAREDETVTVATNSLNDPDGNIVVISYQWNSNGEPVSGADSAAFTIPAALVGTTLSVDVAVADSVFTNEFVAFSASFESVVANANDAATGTVAISNTSPSEGDELQASLENVQDEDGLTNATYAFQWLADGEEITGATNETFSPDQPEVGSVLSVRVTFTDDFGSQESLTSSETAVVTNTNDSPSGSVNIIGSAVVGQMLTASNNLSDEDGLGVISYEWFLNGATTSVTGTSYTVQNEDLGSNISVVASYQDAFGEFESVESGSLLAVSEPIEPDSSLIGSWDLNIEEYGRYDKTILTFTDTGEFFFFNINSIDNDPCRFRGYEYGTYEQVGDEITLTRVIDTNGCVGLFDSTENESSITLNVTDQETQKLTISHDDPEDSFTLTITRILTNPDSIIGPWHEVFEGQQGNVSNLLLFLGDGRMYAMDADPNDTSENDFFFGNFSYQGTSFTRTWVFQGFADNAYAENNDTQIIDNRLIFSEQDSLGRVASAAFSNGAPLAFTETELDAGFSWYFTLLEPEDCGNQWVVEEMNFDSTGYSLDVCGLGTGDEVDEAYEVLESGIVRLVLTEEYVKRMSFDPELQAYLVCWEDTELAASDCAEERQGYAFLSESGAQDYAAEQGGATGEAASLVGSWDFHNEENGAYDKTILSFTATGEFFFFNINSTDNDPCRSRGYEWGTYERVGDDINLTRVIDTNGCVGLFDSTEGESEKTLTVTDEETTSITVSITDSLDETVVISATRVQTNADSLVGPWHEQLDEGGDNNEGNNLSNLLVFLGDGRFYTMDADPTNTSENDFGYGDYSADLDGSGLSLTFQFDGTNSEQLGVERNFPNADIVENELFINTVDDFYGIGRVAVNSSNPDAPLAFTQAELDAGFTWYFPLLEPLDCGNQWVVEEMNFDSTGYSLDVCGLGTGDEVDEAYEVLESGVVRLVVTEEYVKRMSFDPALQAYSVCWEDTELAASDCAIQNRGYGFLSESDAQAYANAQ